MIAAVETMVEVQGGRVWADDSGGDLPPIVLLHPGVGDSRFWEPVLPPLLERFRIVRFDARGHGRSPAPTVPYTNLEDAVAVLDHYGLHGLPLVGCSMGGGTAAGLALADPGRFTSLVLLCPGFPGFELTVAPEVEAEWEALRTADDTEGLIRLAGRLWGAAGLDPDVEEQLRGAVSAWTAIGDLEREPAPVFDRLEDLRVPTVLMVGDSDLPSLIDSNLKAAERIPGCTLVQMPGVDHFPTFRVPDLVVETIVEAAATE